MANILVCLCVARFADPDSDDNVLFDNKESRNTNIKGGTLLKLVERLTYHKYASKCSLSHRIIEIGGINLIDFK